MLVMYTLASSVLKHRNQFVQEDFLFTYVEVMSTLIGQLGVSCSCDWLTKVK